MANWHNTQTSQQEAILNYTIGDRKYALDADWGTLPDGYEFNQVAGVAVDAEDNVYAFNRSDHKLLVLDRDGNLVKVWGREFDQPHGAHVDQEGNVYLVDRDTHVVEIFNRDEELLLTLGTKGQPSDTGHIDEGFMVEKPGEPHNMPTGVSTAPNGDIFVAEGHSGQGAGATWDTVARVVKFDRQGNFIKSWGGIGTAPGQFRTPHGLAMDSRGRLFVADRGNVRIQIFDQDGNFIDQWKQFSRLSGIYIDADDNIYGADSESSATSNPGWRRGIRIGNAATGHVQYFIPDPDPEPRGTTAAEGVAVDAEGNVYGAEVGPRQLVKYVRNEQ